MAKSGKIAKPSAIVFDSNVVQVIPLKFYILYVANTKLTAEITATLPFQFSRILFTPEHPNFGGYQDPSCTVTINNDGVRITKPNAGYGSESVSFRILIAYI